LVRNFGQDIRKRIRVATWNLKRPGTEQARRRVDFLNSRDWDIVTLQEVTPRAWDVIVESGIAESGLYTLHDLEIAPLGNHPHGVALLARNGFSLSAPELIPDLPKAERALAASTTVENLPVTGAGWHAPNAAGEGVKTKMQGYRGISDWLNTISGPVVFGFDSNHWSRSTNLEPPYVPDSDDPWLLENQFFGGNAPHRLRDAFLDHLRQHPLQYEEIVKRRPWGPLAVSYVRGNTRTPVEDRFDYIFVSDDIGITSCSYHYEAAKVAGSDHGIVTADLRLRT